MNRKLDQGKPALTPALSLRGALVRGREASGDASGNLGRFGCERNML
jgi:hypothetical protein